MQESAPDVELCLGAELAQGISERLSEGRAPGALISNKARDNARQLSRSISPACVRNRSGSPMEAAHGCGFLPSIQNMITAQVLFDLQYAVHTLGRDIALARLVVEEGRVLSVVDDDIDLLAAGTVGIDDEGAVNLVPPRKVILEDAQPVILRSLTPGARMRDSSPVAAKLSFEAGLESVEDFGQPIGHGLRYQMIFSQYCSRADCSANLATRSFSCFVRSSESALFVFAGSRISVEMSDVPIVLRA